MKNITELITEKKSTKSTYIDNFGDKYCIRISNIPDNFKPIYHLLKDDYYYYFDNDQGRKDIAGAMFFWDKKDAEEMVKELKGKSKQYMPTFEILTIKTEVINIETVE